MAECSAQLRSDDFAACQAAMTIPDRKTDTAGTDNPRALWELTAWYWEFVDRTRELWIWEGRLMTAQALQQEADRLETRSNHHQAGRSSDVIPRSPEDGIAALAEAKTEIVGTVGAAEVAALIASKLRCIVPMIAVYVAAYLGLSILCGFARPLLGTKVLGPINLGFALIALNYLIAWILAVTYAQIANRHYDPLVQRIVQGAANGGAS
jgi:uncharacterized membrane protein (DUF485 family)